MARSIRSSASSSSPYPLLISQVVVPQRSISRRRGSACAHEVVFRGLARGADGADDAAARRGDVGVRGARQAAMELVAPVAREHGVRVRVHEARDDRALLRVYLHGTRFHQHGGAGLRRGAGEDDAPAVRRDGCVLHGRHTLLERTGERRPARRGDQQASTGHDEVGGNAVGHWWSADGMRR